MDPAPVSDDALQEMHAEVEEIWPRDGRILIRGTAVGDVATGEGTLILRARGHQVREIHLPAGRDRLDGGGDGGDAKRFEVAIALDELAAACTTHVPEQTWDLYLEPAGYPEELRLGRHLDDVAGKKKIFTYPAQAVAGLWIEPYYTIKDNLSITCRREAA